MLRDTHSEGKVIGNVNPEPFATGVGLRTGIVDADVALKLG
jgi:hypothetical protein